MVERKGQAAMEFLMTYGWALLVVLVAIGALAFFGVLNPGQFLPSSCTITPGISCDDFVASTTEVDLILRNGMGAALNSVNVTADGNSCTPAITSIPDGDIGTFTCSGTWTTKEKLKADIGFEYIVGSIGTTSISHSKTGQLVTQVE